MNNTKQTVLLHPRHIWKRMNPRNFNENRQHKIHEQGSWIHREIVPGSSIMDGGEGRNANTQEYREIASMF